MRYAFRCDRKPTIVRDGKHYCWQHDPVRISRIALGQRIALIERERKQQEEFDAKWARRDLETAAQVDKLTDDELRTIVSFGGVREMIKKLTRKKKNE
jgi:hypothetical protein